MLPPQERAAEPAVPDLQGLDLRPRGPVQPSPRDWRDQLIYFLLPDRFSDGKEAGRPLYDRTDPDRHRVQDPSAWQQAGKTFQGGTLRGVTDKLDYLQELGVTTLWLGPIWRQRPDLETYHGYAIQNFLALDPRFGSQEDLRALVEAAHGRGMYVLLDVIFNHTGNNWFYRHAADGLPREIQPFRPAPPYPVHGWRSGAGESVPAIQAAADGVWPREFQNLDWYWRAGSIGRWDVEPWESVLHPEAEFRRGDFVDLKALNVERQDVLEALIAVYRYWIAVSDCDGFRIDTVKHVSREASRRFCGAIHEYAEAIGKENFLLLGEVTGGAALARDYLEILGRNIDAVLDIGEPKQRLSGMVKGFVRPAAYFAQYGGHDQLGGHRETGRFHVSVLDDHDMVGRRVKARFAAGNDIDARAVQVAHAVGVQLTTLGIPCMYYGTEQAFDGSEEHHDEAVEPERTHRDRYVRESMFGGSFGAFRTAGCHFFDRDHPTYLRVAALSRIRQAEDGAGQALRRGRQYLRETSFLGRPFALPEPGELAAWSRILFDLEVLVALNTHGTEGRGAGVTVDRRCHPPGSRLRVLYDGAWSDAELQDPPADRYVEVEERQGRAAVRLDLPPAGMMVLA